jgi:hypothetical protein
VCDFVTKKQCNASQILKIRIEHKKIEGVNPATRVSNTIQVSKMFGWVQRKMLHAGAELHLKSTDPMDYQALAKYARFAQVLDSTESPGSLHH